MTIIHTEIEISASKRRVWEVLMAKHKWKYWNTFLFDCDPSQGFQPGQKVSLSLRRFPTEEEREFQPRVILVQPEVCLKWVSFIPGFQSEYIFELQEIGNKRTQYLHKIRFSGSLERVLVPFIREDEKSAIKRMARELKRYTEGGY